MRKHLKFYIVTSFCLTSVFKTEAFFCNDSDYELNKDTIRNLQTLEVVSETTKKEIRASVPVFKTNTKLLELRGTTDVADAVMRLPGVTLRDYGGSGSLKTMSVRGQGAKHTSIVYDGAVVSDLQSGEIDLSKFAIDNVKELSLYCGENDDIFVPARASGAASSLVISSFHSVIDSVTPIRMNAKIRGGSFGFINPYLRISKSFSNRFAASVNGEYSYSDNAFPFKLYNGTTVTTEKREHSQINTWRSEADFRLKATGGVWQAKYYFYDNRRNLPGPVIYYVDGGHESLHERNWFLQAGYRGTLSENLSLSSLIKHVISYTEYRDINGKYPGGERFDQYNQKETYATLSLLYTPLNNWSFDYSADLINNKMSSNQPNPPCPVRNSFLQSVATKFSVRRLTAVVKGLWTIVDNKVRQGESGKNNNILSPSMSVAVMPLEEYNLYIRVSYKDIFRLPTFNEAYFNNYGSVNLNPEKSHNWNAGVTWQISDAGILKDLSFTCDGYINHVTNKIVAIPYNMFLWTMTNIGKVKVEGLDLTLNCTLGLEESHYLMLSGNWSYQRAKSITASYDPTWNKQVAYLPLNSGNITFAWLNPWISISVNTYATSCRYTTNTNLPVTRMPGYAHTGVSLSRDFKLGRMDLGMRCDLLNIFNKQYEIVARYPLPGRNFRLTINIKI